MYNLIRYIIFSFFVSLMVSCEKIIDVELNESDKKYVIEAVVTNIPGDGPLVRISQTKNFDESNEFKGVSGAKVSIQVNNGTSFTLAETREGIYETKSFIGVSGSTYFLKVIIGSEVFTAVSTMPAQLVLLDYLTIDNFAFGGTNSKIIVPSFLDPLGKGNNYQFIQYTNNSREKNIYVFNDDLNDGLRSTRPLADPDSNNDLESGDFVKVEMFCIDPKVYTYWYSLDQASTGNSSATPANPVSNISGGALGYFSAHSVSSKTILVP